MIRISSFISIFLVLLLIPASAAVRGDKVMYVGGTLSVDEKTKGKISFQDDEKAVFTFKRGTVEIPYKGIQNIEYGQKVGRRVGVAIAVNPLFLFSKKRKHYVTLKYLDADGNEQGVAFEFGKKKVRNALNILGTRSGKAVEYQSEEAKKNLP